MRVLTLGLVGFLAGCAFDSSGLGTTDAATDQVKTDTAGIDARADLPFDAGLDSTEDHGALDLPADVALLDARVDILISDAPQPDGPQPDGAQPDTSKPDLPSLDMNNGPLVIEAESYSTKKSLDGTHNWVVQSNVAKYSGTGFIIALPGSPDMNCLSNHTTCGAQADYNFSLTTAATHLHFRVYSEDGDSNSMRWGIDGVYQSNMVGWSPFQTWTFTTMVKSLAAGPHKLTLWMRENNVRVDQIVVSNSATPPGP